ncbi:MAG TPA: sugar ABC transporter permease [Fimbriimonadaceae bacterium]|nr:sugar ABC transporter permease [Fimbriimonadaceae bacterium]
MKRRTWIGLAFCSPLIVGLLAFTVIPVVASAWFSLCNYPILDPPKYIGAANYTELVRDDQFWHSIRNTFTYVLMAVPLGMAVGLVLALLMNQKVRGIKVFRTLFFLPTVVPVVANAVLWVRVLNPQQGLVNSFLRAIHLPESFMPGWLADEHWALPGLVLMSLWGAGGGAILYVAALKDVPAELFEAAELDGAGPVQRFRRVTIPLISPVLLFTGIMGLIGGFQEFTRAMVMTQGGPWDSTLFYCLHLFNSAFTEFRLGYASAMAWVLFAIILTATIVVMRLSIKHVQYEQ